jgi:hypothetical protein
MSELYIPAFETQRDQGAPLPWTNCTLASGAMLVDWWTYGRQRTNDIELRAASGVHPSLGVNFAALRKAVTAVEKLDLRFSEWDRSGNANITWATLRAHLANHGGAAVAGQYRAIRPFRSSTGHALDRWQPGGDFGHAVFVCDYRPSADGGDGMVRWMDPLGHGTYTGDRIPLEALWAFLFKSGNTQDAYIAAAHAFTGTRADGPAPKGLTGEIVFRDPQVHQTWVVKQGAIFTRANGTFGQFNLSVPVLSIVEMTVGGVDARLLDFGPDHEQLVIARSWLTDPGTRHVGFPDVAAEVRKATAPLAEQIGDLDEQIAQARIHATRTVEALR